MVNYDFSALSPLDFEQLINDLVQAKVGTRVERFGPGSDGGIDGRYAMLGRNSVIQAKHYKNSKFHSLLNSLKKSKQQIIDLNPHRYIICTSQNLSPQRKDEIVENLKPINITTADVWGRDDLNSLLMEFPSVERAHIKLWLNSSSVLERIVNADIHNRTNICLDDMRRAAQLFVYYDGYTEAARILDNQNILIITGPPGVGKTTLALVLAAQYMEKGWEVVAVSNINQAYTATKPEEKQIFFFDDFLGSIRLDRDFLSKEDSDFNKFFSFVRRNKLSKKFIMTSRGYIYKEAKFLSETFSSKSHGIADLVIDIKSYTDEIKSKILYNHLYFSALTRPYLEALIGSQVIDKVISHKNYMPRLVEWLTDPERLNFVVPEEYEKHVMETLDKPNEVWQKAVEEHLQPSCRLLLHCIFFSLRNRRFDKDYVTWFAEALQDLSRRKNFAIRDRELFKCLKALEGSFIEINGQAISYINPSLEDYIHDTVYLSSSLPSLAETCQTRSQVMIVWKYIKAIRSEKNTGLAKVYRSLTDRCLLEDSSISGSVPLRDFLQFSKDASEVLGQPIILEQAVVGHNLDKLDLDIVELPALFKELSDGEYGIRSVSKLREYLSDQLISELKETEFEQEDAAAILEAFEKHHLYVNSAEKAALCEMADLIVDNVVIPGSNEGEDELSTVLDEYNVLERWCSDSKSLEDAKYSVSNRLQELHEYRQNQKIEAWESYRSSPLYNSKRSGKSVAVSSSQGFMRKGSYHDLFSSLLPPEDE